MFNRIELIHLQAGLAAAEREHLLRTLREAAMQGTDCMLQPTLPGVYNGGDYLWRQRGPQHPLCTAAAQALLSQPHRVARVDSVAFRDGEEGGNWNGPGVYRALLLSVKSSAGADTLARFESEVLAMPRYIPSIRAWRLSRVAEAAGARTWTHVWEQRYDELAGLSGPYMLHPYHWAWVDRWFDPESPDWIVDTHLCHSFCRLG